MESILRLLGLLEHDINLTSLETPLEQLCHVNNHPINPIILRFFLYNVLLFDGVELTDVEIVQHVARFSDRRVPGDWDARKVEFGWSVLYAYQAFMFTFKNSEFDRFDKVLGLLSDAIPVILGFGTAPDRPVLTPGQFTTINHIDQHLVLNLQKPVMTFQPDIDAIQTILGIQYTQRTTEQYISDHYKIKGFGDVQVNTRQKRINELESKLIDWHDKLQMLFASVGVNGSDANFDDYDKLQLLYFSHPANQANLDITRHLHKQMMSWRNLFFHMQMVRKLMITLQDFYSEMDLAYFNAGMREDNEILTPNRISNNIVRNVMMKHHYEEIVQPSLKAQEIQNESFEKMYLLPVSPRETQYNLFVLFELVWCVESNKILNGLQMGGIKEREKQIKDVLLKSHVTEDMIKKTYNIWKKFQMVGPPTKPSITLFDGMDKHVSRFIIVVRVIQKKYNTDVALNEHSDATWSTTAKGKNDLLDSELNNWTEFVINSVMERYKKTSIKYFGNANTRNQRRDTLARMQVYIHENANNYTRALEIEYIDYLLYLNPSTQAQNNSIVSDLLHALNWGNIDEGHLPQYKDLLRNPNSILKRINAVQINVSQQPDTFFVWMKKHIEQEGTRREDMGLNVFKSINLIESEIMASYEHFSREPSRENTETELVFTVIPPGQFVCTKGINYDGFNLSVPIPKNFGINRFSLFSCKDGAKLNLVSRKLVTNGTDGMLIVVMAPTWETGVYSYFVDFEVQDNNNNNAAGYRTIGSAFSSNISVSVIQQCQRCLQPMLQSYAPHGWETPKNTECKFTANLKMLRQELIDHRAATNLTLIHEYAYSLLDRFDKASYNKQPGYVRKVEILQIALDRKIANHLILSMTDVITAKKLENSKRVLGIICNQVQSFAELIYLNYKDLVRKERNTISLDDIDQMKKFISVRKLTNNAIDPELLLDPLQYRPIGPEYTPNMASREQTFPMDNGAPNRIYDNVPIVGQHSAMRVFLQFPRLAHSTAVMQNVFNKFLYEAYNATQDRFTVLLQRLNVNGIPWTGFYFIVGDTFENSIYNPELIEISNNMKKLYQSLVNVISTTIPTQAQVRDILYHIHMHNIAYLTLFLGDI